MCEEVGSTVAVDGHGWSSIDTPRRLSWHALVVGPLSPPACLSLKSSPDRSDPVHLITSGRVARLARSLGPGESKTSHEAVALYNRATCIGDVFHCCTQRPYVLMVLSFHPHIGIGKDLPIDDRL